MTAPREYGIQGLQSGLQKAVEPSDPMQPTAVSLSTPGYDGMAAMARTFVEEFALMGRSREQIARMFKQPTFVAAYSVYSVRGAEFIDGLIREVFDDSTSAPTQSERE